MFRSSTRIIIYLLGVLGILRGEEEYIDVNVVCNKIDRDVNFDVVREKCYFDDSLAGTGSITIGKADEVLMYNFFMNKVYINVSLVIDQSTTATIMSFGTTKVIRSMDPKRLALLIENTNLETIELPAIEQIHGTIVRGNRYLSADSLYALKTASVFNKPVQIQPYGECNFFLVDDEVEANFDGCRSANNLFLLEEQKVPADFYPQRIAGCVYLQKLNITHNLLRDVKFTDITNMECEDPEFPQVIADNPSFCLKEFEFFLNARNIFHGRNDNIECKFDCYEGQIGEDTRNDITDYYQRWCETLEGDLVINDDLADNVNLTEVVMHLKKINGRLIIENLTNENKKRNETVTELIFPSLEMISGGVENPPSLIFVNNTKLKKLSFPKLTELIEGETALEITDHNPDLRMTKDDFMMVDIAANGIPYAIPKSLLLEDEEEDDNTAIIVGSIFGCLGLIVLVVGIVATVLIVRKRKSKNKSKSKAKGKENKLDKAGPPEAGEAGPKDGPDVPLLGDDGKKGENRKKKTSDGKFAKLAKKIKDKIMPKKKKSEEKANLKKEEKPEQVDRLKTDRTVESPNVPKSPDVEPKQTTKKPIVAKITVKGPKVLRSVDDKTQSIDADV